MRFTDNEENVAPEDCFLSRQIFQYTHADPEMFLEDFNSRNWSSPYFSSPHHAISVRHEVRARAVLGIYEYMVELSDTANLMDKILAGATVSTHVHDRGAEQFDELLDSV